MEKKIAKLCRFRMTRDANGSRKVAGLAKIKENWTTQRADAVKRLVPWKTKWVVPII
jgi:hypothetical protein